MNWHIFSKKISSHLRIDADYLFRNGFFITIGTGLTFLVTFIVAVVFANFVDPSVYGYYKYVLAVVAILSALNFSSIPSVLPRSIAQELEGTYKYLSLLYAKWSLVSVIIALAISLYYYLNDNHLLAFSIAVAGILSPLVRSLDFYGSFLEGKKKFKEMTLFHTIYVLVPNSTLIFTLFHTDSVILVVSAYFLSSLVTNICITWYIFRVYKPNESVDYGAKKFVGHTSVMNLLGIFSSQIDKILIFQFVGAAQVALYSIALAIPTQFQAVSKGIRTILYPKMSTQKFGEIRLNANWRVLLLLITVSTIYLSYFFTAPYIFQTFFPVYIDGVLITQVLALSLFFYPVLPYQLALYVYSREKELYTIKITSTIFKIGALMVLLPLFGLWGAVFAFLVPFVVEGVMYTWIFNVKLRHLE